MDEEAARLPCGLQGHTQETDTESHGPDTQETQKVTDWTPVIKHACSHRPGGVLIFLVKESPGLEYHSKLGAGEEVATSCREHASVFLCHSPLY